MRFLLATVATSALMSAAAPAFAQDGGKGIEMGMTGYFKGYMVYNTQDEAVGTTEERNVDIIRDTELHFVGSMTLDNGLTVGADIGAAADQGDSFDVTDSFVYFSGDWGRVNFGATDGAAYLLQVSAPSADANYDGMDQYYTPFNYAITGNATLPNLEFDYDQDATSPSDKLTYITPNFSGFQAAASYTPEIRTASRGTNGVDDDESSTSEFGDAWDLSGRYSRAFDGFDMTLGAGYTHAAVEVDSATNDDREQWNAGLDFNIGAFGVGAVYTHDNLGADNRDQEQWLLGVDYTMGNYVLGASYLDQANEVTSTTDIDTQRYTGGVTYKYGPGVDFRGVVSHINHDVDGGLDIDGTAVMLGTSITF
jgi:outer membrane protein OmpU